MSSDSFFGLLRSKLNFGQILQQSVARFTMIKRFQKWGWTMALGMAAIGALYGLLNPKLYEASVTIAIEDDESGGWSMMLEQFGIDVGGTNPGGIFKGEALVKLFTMRSQIERTLLRTVDLPDGTQEPLVNLYLESSPLIEKEAFKNANFTSDRTSFSSTQDSLLKIIYTDIVKNVVDVSKPETKLSLITINVVHEDPYFAKVFAEEAVKNTRDFYIETVSIKAQRNFEVLYREVDSVQQVLADNMTNAAVLSDININPSRQILRLDQNRNSIELQINAALYSELVKSLKLAEIGLRKETPLIQTVDTPQFPLDQKGLEWWEYASLLFLVGGAMYILVFFIIPTE
jgi:hypothetical protein